MCGIAGHVSWRASPDESELLRMMGRLAHRGPDDRGSWRSSDGLCALGHLRLSIVDLSPAGRQPMLDPLTGNVIVFNGEIYNFKELRKARERAGEIFHSGTDTEVILSLYREHGVDCLSQLRGMFAFAIWDCAEQRLFLARDRIGKKPLNYAISSDGMIFASELEALVRHPAVRTEMDGEALELYLQLQYIPAPWSIYKGVRKLPPAHYAICDRDGFRIQKYWDIDYRVKTKVSEQDAVDGFEEILGDAVRLRMIADVPVGALLSGGVDSSLVVAMMARAASGPVRTYSIGFHEEEFNELSYARIVADRYHTEHHPEIVKAEIDVSLLQVARQYGEPFGDSSAIPSFSVCRAARKHVKVVMNGDGGDELLGGYHRYFLKPLSISAGRFLRNIHSPTNLARMLCGITRVVSVPGRVRRKWLLRVANPELQSLLMYSDFWNDEERAGLLGHQSSVMHQWRECWLAKVRDAADNPVDRMLWMDNRTYLPGDLLVKMDIASMHCGLETRSPLLDHKVIEYCAALPVDMKVRDATGKYLLKKLAERYLPREVIYRRKMGFGIPLAKWLRGPLRSVLEETLQDRNIMFPLEMPVISRTLDEFLNQGMDHGARLWLLLMFGTWRRQAAV